MTTRNVAFVVLLFLVATVGNPALSGQTVDLSGAWQGTVSRGDRNWNVRVSVWSDASVTRACLDFPDYGLYYRCTADVALTASSARIHYESGRDALTFDGRLADVRYSGNWRGLGVDARFDLVRVGAAPAPLVEEPVRFRNGSVELAGTLVRPAGAQRYAAVVWTHGSGNQRRTADFYRDRAYLLAENGVAGLIYDKRGVGESTGDSVSTLDELAGDAVAAVQFLQRRSDVDPARIGVGGFSQGGFVAPLAATRYGHIAFVLTGATPGATPAELNDYAARTALARQGFTADVIDRAMHLRGQVLHAQETGESLEALEARLAEVRTEPWFAAADLPAERVQQYGRRGLSVLHFDPVRVWQRVRVPVLALWGEEDALVPVDRSRRAIEAAVNVRPNASATTRVFPGAGHGLAVTPPAGEWDWPRLADGFHPFMVQWVLGVVSRGSA